MSLNDTLARWFRRRASPSKFHHGSGSGSFTLALNEHLLILHVAAHPSGDVTVTINGEDAMVVRAGTELTWPVAGDVSGVTVSLVDSSGARWFAEYVATDG